MRALLADWGPRAQVRSNIVLAQWHGKLAAQATAEVLADRLLELLDVSNRPNRLGSVLWVPKLPRG